MKYDTVITALNLAIDIYGKDKPVTLDGLLSVIRVCEKLDSGVYHAVRLTGQKPTIYEPQANTEFCF